MLICKETVKRRTLTGRPKAPGQSCPNSNFVLNLVSKPLLRSLQLVGPCRKHVARLGWLTYAHREPETSFLPPQQPVRVPLTGTGAVRTVYRTRQEPYRTVQLEVLTLKFEEYTVKIDANV